MIFSVQLSNCDNHVTGAVVKIRPAFELHRVRKATVSRRLILSDAIFPRSSDDSDRCLEKKIIRRTICRNSNADEMDQDEQRTTNGAAKWNSVPD